MLECVVITKDLACRGRVNAATIENDAWCVEKTGCIQRYSRWGIWIFIKF